MRNVALDALLSLINDIMQAKVRGAVDGQLATAQNYQRKDQFLVDFIEAENSMGFHAPQEAARLLARSIDYSRQGQASLGNMTVNPPAAPNAIPAPQGVSPSRAQKSATR